MRILINVSNIRKSGALQVALSFLNEIIAINRFEYIIVLSKQVASQIDRAIYPNNFSFYEVDCVAALQKGHGEYKKQMNSIVETDKIDCVFSVFGPTYWSPKVLHIAGFAYGWLIYTDSPYMNRLSRQKKILLKLENLYKKYYLRSDAKYYITETDDVRLRLNKYVGINKDNIFVVNNTFNHHFSKKSIDNSPKKSDHFSLLVLSSYFPHKNLDILNYVAQILNEKGINDIRFLLSLNEEEFKSKFNHKFIINLGTLKAADCPSAYIQCDAMILPTLVECFTATYPEAMIMERPILTSDLSFAHGICEDAAIYFDPLSAEDIVEKILLLKNDKELYNNLVEKGKERVKVFPTARERAEQYLAICERIHAIDYL